MRRPSAYETRARELAALAGLDPDSPVARPGEVAKDGVTRGQPAWCTFQDAARAEHMQAEIAAVTLPEQANAYKDAPLQVFGTH